MPAPGQIFGQQQAAWFHPSHAAVSDFEFDCSVEVDHELTLRGCVPVKLPPLLGTDPQNPDTDSDGVSDGAEVLAETDPLAPVSFSNQPAAVPASSLGVRLFLALLLLLGAGRIVQMSSRLAFTAARVGASFSV